MKINCLSCGHNVGLDDAYGDFEGQVKCFGCGAVLEIRTEGGSLKAVKLAKTVSEPSLEEAVKRAP